MWEVLLKYETSLKSTADCYTVPYAYPGAYKIFFPFVEMKVEGMWRTLVPMGAQDTALWCELHQDQCPPLRWCTFQIGTQAYYSGNIYNFLSFIKRAERDQEGNKL